MRHAVITSYSIHYTKLYERLRGCRFVGRLFSGRARRAFGSFRGLICSCSQIFKVELFLLNRDGNVLLFLFNDVEGIEGKAAAAAYRIGSIGFSATRTVFGENAQRTTTYRQPEGPLIATCMRLPIAKSAITVPGAGKIRSFWLV